MTTVPGLRSAVDLPAPSPTTTCPTDLPLLIWDGTVTAPAVVSALAVLAALATYVAGRRRDNRIKRAELVNKYAETLFTRSDLFDEFCKIDNDRLVFRDDSSWLDADDERALIRLLDHFNGVAHSVFRGILRVKDLRGTTLWYAMLRAYNDPAVKLYLEWVDRFDDTHGGTGDAFRYFRELGPDFRKTQRWSQNNPPVRPEDMTTRLADADEDGPPASK